MHDPDSIIDFPGGRGCGALGMKPTSPVVPGTDLPETTYAKDQPEYEPLPVFRYDDGTVLSRWRMTWRERLRALFLGDVYLYQLTFGQPLQPVMLQVDRPELDKRGQA